MGIKLAGIPRDADYRYEVIFRAYKWDPQVGDSNTIARHALLMDADTARQLEVWAEQLSEETMRMEEALIDRPALYKKLGFPKETRKALEKMTGYGRDKNIRLMRFDFHPTTAGWAISEVNSDVPGGLAEASSLPVLAARYFEGYAPAKNTADALLQAFRDKIPAGGSIAFVHATSYADDRQVMQFLGDSVSAAGYRALYAAPDHIVWEGNKAQGIDAIVRFYPLEWLANLPKKSAWTKYFNSETPACNHPAAMLTQSKRLPLVWDELGVELPAWKTLLPQTGDPKSVKQPSEDWVLKPALGRVGEGIAIRGTMPEKERRQIAKAARREPQNWVAQRKFESLPLTSETGEIYHLCVGVFTVDGKSAGFYGRINPYPRMDANAKDIAILINCRGEACLARPNTERTPK
ncbi:MAG: glutathionylspermidine synthase family protein [Clostridiales bacterium]|nr:glutathionylspermidine synthase family protein [Clostridiales bacterium]